MSRSNDYFTFLGLPRRLNIDMALLERRFRDLSRDYHPDYFYNAPAKERLAALERSSHLNDAYRTLRNPVSRIDYLLGLEGLPLSRAGEGSPKVPPALLEEVFALNEELDEVRELRESGGELEELQERLAAARAPIERKREAHERELQALSARWDEQQDRGTLEQLRERMLERNYINNLLATIDREVALSGSGLQATGFTSPDAETPKSGGPSPEAGAREVRSPEPGARSQKPGAPEVRSQESGARSPEPPKPEARSPEPEVRSPKPGAAEVRSQESEARSPEPLKPEARSPEPEVRSPKPGAPEVRSQESEARSPEPPKPEARSPEPE